MDLVKLNSQVPIKAIPQEEFNHVLLMIFTPWLCGLLSLTDEVSANRLEVALPAIKEHCWSMGFVEIKKMFEMYADNKLSVKPLPNYFDRILLGKIVEAYKQQKPRPKVIMEKPELTQEEKDIIVYMGVLNCFEAYRQDKVIEQGRGYVYDFFFELGKLPKHDETFRNDIKKRATAMLQDSLEEYNGKKLTTQLKDRISDIKKGKGLKAKMKQIVLMDYFDRLIKEKIDIKTEMK